MTTPTFTPTFLSCKCGHEWTDYLPYNVRVELWSAAVELLRCPKCGAGSRKIMFGQTAKETPVEVTKPLSTRLAEWYAGPDTGLSSVSIAAQLVGAGPPKVRGWSYPSDPDDLGRWLRLLRLIPEWKERIGEMAECCPEWAALIAVWAVLEATILEEVGLFWEKAKAAPKTYAMMRAAIERARKAA